MCARSGTFQFQCPLSWKCALPQQGGCATRHPAGDVCATIRSVAQLQRAKLSPLSSAFFELGETQTSTLSGRASVRARGREPDVTGIPSAPLEPSPFMIRLRHHLSRTTGVLAQHQHRGTVESRRGIRLSVRMWIVFRKRQKANFPLAQDAAAPFLITFFDDCWYEDSGTAESEEFLWTRLQGQPLGHGIGKQC